MWSHDAIGWHWHTNPPPFILDQGNLTVTALRASNLKAADRSGTSDPFVIFTLDDLKVHKTEVIKKNLNPVFKNEMFTVPVVRLCKSQNESDSYLSLSHFSIALSCWHGTQGFCIWLGSSWLGQTDWGRIHTIHWGRIGKLLGKRSRNRLGGRWRIAQGPTSMATSAISAQTHWNISLLGYNSYIYTCFRNSCWCWYWCWRKSLGR